MLNIWKPASDAGVLVVTRAEIDKAIAEMFVEHHPRLTTYNVAAVLKRLGFKVDV